MRTADGCKLFGVHQALAGIKDGVILFHSVVGCNFGSMAFHLPHDMRDIRQTCTVISDSDVVFSGEPSLERAIDYTLEQFSPSVVFVVTGCVSEMVGDDVRSVLSRFPSSPPLLYVEAAGFRGSLLQGYEASLLALLPLMEPPRKKQQNPPRINLLGLGSSDYRMEEDIQTLGALMEPQAELGTAFSSCTLSEVRAAASASLNLVVGRGIQLAREMEKRFGIPYEEIDYPYGVLGSQEIFHLLQKHFGISCGEKLTLLKERAANQAGRIYPYLQALYGRPAAVIGSEARSRGMKRFLEEELGMVVVAMACREKLSDLELFYQQVRQSETALLFGSSFEQDLAEELGIPLIRCDYPVFDQVCITPSPYVGTDGTAYLLESIVNGIMGNRGPKGALYQ